MVPFEAQLFLILMKFILSVFFFCCLSHWCSLVLLGSLLKLNIILGQEWTLFRIESFKYFYYGKF